MKKKKINPDENRYSDESQKDEDQIIEGVGRAGASEQSLPTAGITEAELARIRNLGMSRLRINRPGEDK